MDFIADNKEYFYAVTIPLTIIAVVASTTYTIQNIMGIWRAGKPKPVDDREDDSESDDAAEDEDFGIVKSKDIHVDAAGDHDHDSQEDTDPLQYCEHIQSEVKKARQRVATREIQQHLTEEDLVKEREIQRKQLEQIFNLMEQNNDKFGTAAPNDVYEQMKLYA